MHDPRVNDHRAVLFLTDLVLAGAAFLCAGLFRFGWSFVSIWNADIRYPDVQILTPALALSVNVVFWVAGVYRHEAYLTIRREVRDVVRAAVLTMLTVLSILYALKLPEFSRITLALFFVNLVVLTVGARFLLRRWWRGTGLVDPLRVLLVGTDGSDRVLKAASDAADLPIRVIGFLGRESDMTADLERLGDLMDLPAILAGHVVDEVIVCLPVNEWDRLDAIGAVCAEQGKVMRVPVDVAQNTLRKGRVEYLDGIPLLTLRTTADARVGLLAKRALDVVVSGALLVVLLPLLLVVALGLLVSERPPILFSQERGGLNGRPFRFHKFRTMSPDAERLKSLLVDQNERQGPAFKIENDPRVTRFGRILRRSSLDELPQLWNVFRGDMSLVGPRPPTLDEVAVYDPWHRRRLSVRPGITGLWQVTSRDDPNFDRWVDLDLEYIDSWSFWTDVKILVMTPSALFRTPGS